MLILELFAHWKSLKHDFLPTKQNQKLLANKKIEVIAMNMKHKWDNLWKHSAKQVYYMMILLARSRFYQSKLWLPPTWTDPRGEPSQLKFQLKITSKPAFLAEIQSESFASHQRFGIKFWSCEYIQSYLKRVLPRTGSKNHFGPKRVLVLKGVLRTIRD